MDFSDLRSRAGALAPELVDFRRRMHADPEVGLELPRTQQRVLEAIDGLGLELTTGTRTTSVGAVLRGGPGAAGSDRPVVLLRADMDALPVAEEVDVDYRSTNGAMHACGHDLHTAMLVGAARLLAEQRDRLPGDVVLMFQPGEEGMGGARIMIEEGILDLAGPRASAAFGMHVFAAMAPGGIFLTCPGPMLAASDGFRVVVRGRGGHGSAPHRSADPVPVLAEIITALQTVVTRRFDAFDPAVVTVGYVRAGTKRNVIPDTAEFDATVRTFSSAHAERMREVLPRVARGIAEAHGLTAEVTYSTEYPVTVTDADETARAEQLITGLVGSDRHSRMEHALTGSEDFSFVLDEVPGTFVGLSAVPPGVDPATSDYNHSPRATFDDAVLADGTALYAAWALDRLAALSGSAEQEAS
ncbi:hippurate hydrolase [Friedmanniella endophytica]|uniref:Hippurate hydrolase n=1 Tax=Microlunatus kandeliicorticis TaxID=1759536 RepID=A0A7W3IP41_9ACTN|nr:M20 family metallopeptidase [Microlunatus kandeliicorticis]MBA8792654.1 hippurate hydrolase [Microlunatus kandeliicorticis]